MSVVCVLAYSQNTTWYRKNAFAKNDNERIWIDKVDEFIKPHYILLSSGWSSCNLYEDHDINNDGKNELIVSVSGTTNFYIGASQNETLYATEQIYDVKKQKLTLKESNERRCCRNRFIDNSADMAKYDARFDELVTALAGCLNT